MWFLIFCVAVGVFWALNIYFRDDGKKLKHSPVIDGPEDQKDYSQLANVLTWIIGLAFVVALIFVFVLTPEPAAH